MLEQQQQVVESDDYVLFMPRNIILLLLNEATGRIDKKINIVYRDKRSACLKLFDEDDSHDDRVKSSSSNARDSHDHAHRRGCNGTISNDEEGKDGRNNHRHEIIYILDLLTTISKLKEELDVLDKNKCSIRYRYQRFSTITTFEVIPTSSIGIRELQAFDFLMGQYSLKNDYSNRKNNNHNHSRGSSSEQYSSRDDDHIISDQDHKPNIIAQGLEATGATARVALRSSGRWTGHAIRYLGKHYTSSVARSSSLSSSSSSSSSLSSTPPILSSQKKANDRVINNSGGDGCSTNDDVELSSFKSNHRATITTTEREDKDITTNCHITSDCSADTVTTDIKHMNSDHSIVDHLNSDHYSNTLQNEDTGIEDKEKEKDRAMQSETALASKQWAEGVHTVATTITSAVLFPVRTIGRLAADTFGRGGSDVVALTTTTSTTTTATTAASTTTESASCREEENVVHRAIYDTVGGLGNGVMNICKGVTEALGEIGSAIGDSAMYHSLQVNGPEYAEMVTKHYVDAAGEIGLAGYKVVNVASLGLHGVMINAVMEGTSYSLGLYDYLVGPILIQGYMYMMQQPMMNSRRYFVVLRPWSIAFYSSALDISQKPHKIIAVSMLDTLPKLRIRASQQQLSGQQQQLSGRQQQLSGQQQQQGGVSSEADIEEDDDGFECKDDDDNINNDKDDNNKDSNSSAVPTCEISSEPILLPIIDTSVDAAYFPSSNTTTTTTYQTLSRANSSHIEICTVDCSTYLLYLPEHVIHEWYTELVEAVNRVETIAKRKSGADEIAMTRRLNMMPLTHYIKIK